MGRVNKYLQQGPTPYTPQWYDIYKAGRANNEGRNASLKYDAPLGDGDRSKRVWRNLRLRGQTRGASCRLECQAYSWLSSSSAGGRTEPDPSTGRSSSEKEATGHLRDCLVERPARRHPGCITDHETQPWAVVYRSCVDAGFSRNWHKKTVKSPPKRRNPRLPNREVWDFF